MSRIGKKPVPVPKGVEIKLGEGEITVRGPKGELRQHIAPELVIEVKDGELLVGRPNDSARMRAQHGLVRTLVNNMVVGVSDGFTRTLSIVGVGYRVSEQGAGIQLALGYSHPINIDPIPGITFQVEVDNRAKINKLHIHGIDKQKVGQVAANIRGLRPPEPYKGKGIRYVDEVIQKKMGKAGKA